MDKSTPLSIPFQGPADVQSVWRRYGWTPSNPTQLSEQTMKTNHPQGRRATDGVKNPDHRVNAAVTELHKQRLETMAKKVGISAWLRMAIDKAWAARKEGGAK